MDDQVPPPRRIYEDIASQLIEKINRGEYPAGSLLPSERELAEMFGASRPAIRDALLSLRTSGLISVRQKSRARVTPMNSASFLNQLAASAQVLLGSPNGLSDFMELRALLECGLARHAARYASPRDIERLAGALEDNRLAMHDTEAFVEADYAFHRAIAEITRNPIIVSCQSAMLEWMKVQRSVGLPIRELIKVAYQGHEGIYKAIADRDPEAAYEAAAGHLRTVSDLIRKAQAGGRKKR